MKSKPLAGAPSRPVRLYLVDDDVAFASLLGREISGWPEVQLAGYAPSGRHAIAEVAARDPDIVSLEASLKDCDSLALATTLMELCPRVLVILLLSGFSDFLIYRIAKSAAISGIVVKAADIPQELRQAIRSVQGGHRHFPRSFDDARRALWQKPDAFFKILSEREQTLIPLLGSGATNDEIAGKVGLRPAGIQAHRQRIMSRLGFHRAQDLMLWQQRPVSLGCLSGLSCETRPISTDYLGPFQITRRPWEG